LKYRGTRDGFSSGSFSTKCGGVANTLTIIKSTSGNIFGGFAEKAWILSLNWIVDPKAYIFSIVNKDNKPFKSVSNNDGGTICETRHGPAFGGVGKGSDIYVSLDSNINQSSCCNFGSSYKHADYQFGTEKTKTILAGSYNFQTAEIEVFSASN
jgi:hypothetical protein